MTKGIIWDSSMSSENSTITFPPNTPADNSCRDDPKGTMCLGYVIRTPNCPKGLNMWRGIPTAEFLWTENPKSWHRIGMRWECGTRTRRLVFKAHSSLAPANSSRSGYMRSFLSTSQLGKPERNWATQLFHLTVEGNLGCTGCDYIMRNLVIAQ